MSRLHRIEQLLNTINGIAVICYVDLSSRALPMGERDATDDIPDMARTDHIWSVAIAFGVASTLKWLVLHGLILHHEFEIYYDTRSIKDGHRLAFHQAVTEGLPGIVREIASEGRQLNIRQISDISKAKRRIQPNVFQAGVLSRIDY